MVQQKLVFNPVSNMLGHWCAGCKEIHYIAVAGTSGQEIWTWNEDVMRPTISPSVKISVPQCIENGVVEPERVMCHYFIREGRIEYCADCDHALASTSMELTLIDVVNPSFVSAPPCTDV